MNDRTRTIAREGHKLRALSLEGFKNFKERSTVQLAPITLIFGENSVGKSTLLEALMLRAQTASGDSHQEPNTAGRLIDFGPSSKVLLNKKAKSQKFTIGVGTDIAPWWKSQRNEGTPTISRWLPAGAKKVPPMSDYEQVYTKIMQEDSYAPVQTWRSKGTSSFALVDQNYRPISSSETPLLRISRLQRKWKVKFISHSANFWEEILRDVWINWLERVQKVFSGEILDNAGDHFDQTKHFSKPQNLSDGFRKILFMNKTTSAPLKITEEEVWRSLRESLQKIPTGSLEIRTRKGVFSSNISSETDDFFGPFRESYFHHYGDITEIAHFLDSLVNPNFNLDYRKGHRVVMSDESYDEEYKGDLEDFCSRFGLDEDAPQVEPWKFLKYDTDEALSNCFDRVSYLSSKRPLLEMNAIFWANQGADPVTFKEGLSIDALASNLYYHPDILDEVNEWLEILSANFFIFSRHDTEHEFYFFRAASRDNQWETTLDNIGSGLQQLIPIVAQTVGLREKIMLVEEPETHLHPRFQRELADFFLEYKDRNQHQFLLETHSEPMVHRFLELVRSGELSHEDLAIIYVTADDNGSHAKNYEINKDGEFAGGWPEELFPISY